MSVVVNRLPLVINTLQRLVVLCSSTPVEANQAAAHPATWYAWVIGVLGCRVRVVLIAVVLAPRGELEQRRDGQVWRGLLLIQSVRQSCSIACVLGLALLGDTGQQWDSLLVRWLLTSRLLCAPRATACDCLASQSPSHSLS